MYCFMYFGIASPFPSMDFFHTVFFCIELDHGNRVNGLTEMFF